MKVLEPRGTICTKSGENYQRTKFSPIVRATDYILVIR